MMRSTLSCRVESLGTLESSEGILLPRNYTRFYFLGVEEKGKKEKRKEIIAKVPQAKMIGLQLQCCQLVVRNFKYNKNTPSYKLPPLIISSISSIIILMQ